MALPFKLVKTILNKTPLLLNFRRAGRKKFVIRDCLFGRKEEKKSVGLDRVPVLCYIYRHKERCHAYERKVCFNPIDYDT